MTRSRRQAIRRQDTSTCGAGKLWLLVRRGVLQAVTRGSEEWWWHPAATIESPLSERWSTPPVQSVLMAAPPPSPDHSAGTAACTRPRAGQPPRQPTRTKRFERALARGGARSSSPLPWRSCWSWARLSVPRCCSGGRWAVYISRAAGAVAATAAAAGAVRLVAPLPPPPQLLSLFSLLSGRHSHCKLPSPRSSKAAQHLPPMSWTHPCLPAPVPAHLQPGHGCAPQLCAGGAAPVPARAASQGQLEAQPGVRGPACRPPAARLSGLA